MIANNLDKPEIHTIPFRKLRENHRTREITRARVSRRELQSTLSKTDTFGTGTKCPSYWGDRGVRLIEVSVKRESTVLVV